MKTIVTYESTPNPQSLKFIVNQDICEETFEIKDIKQTARSPLATKILNFPWAKSVFLGKNFITITKEDWVEWEALSDPIGHLIQEHLEQGGGILLPKAKEAKTSQEASSDSPDVKKIKMVLEKEIQPAVAMDGGAIQFVSYEDKKVYVSLQGACAGCPSSTMTLKMGIETRLKQIVPEIIEVIAL